MFPNIFGTDGSLEAFKQFVADSKASRNVQKIAKALLTLFLSLQESKGFDEYLQTQGKTSSNSSGSNAYKPWSGCGPNSPCGKTIEKGLKSLDELILSDDELGGTLDGIECFMLQAKYDSNDGRIRRSWNYTRRGLSLAQMLGLHRRAKNLPPDEALRRESVWKMFYQVDRYMSLLLGLPYGVNRAHTEMDRTVYETPESYSFRLGDIAGDVIDRNLNSSPDGNYMQTMQIEGSLVDLANSMPKEWWDPGINNNGVELGKQLYDRLLPHFWHHQVRTLLHLPFMLKATQDRRYEYSKIACLESAGPASGAWIYVLGLQSRRFPNFYCSDDADPESLWPFIVELKT